MGLAVGGTLEPSLVPAPLCLQDQNFKRFHVAASNQSGYFAAVPNPLTIADGPDGSICAWGMTFTIDAANSVYFTIHVYEDDPETGGVRRQVGLLFPFRTDADVVALVNGEIVGAPGNPLMIELVSIVSVENTLAPLPVMGITLTDGTIDLATTFVNPP